MVLLSRSLAQHRSFLSLSTRRWIASEILVSDNNLITSITLNRPSAANAMGSKMLSQLEIALEDISNRPTTRCVILKSAAASNVFSAGADLKERSEMTLEEAERFVHRLRTTFHKFASLPIPTIAAIDGIAVGGGLELALAADIRVATSNSKFGLPETSLAIIPGAGGTQRLPRLIGLARAKELIFTGRIIDASTAYSYGLVGHVVDCGQAEGKARE